MPFNESTKSNVGVLHSANKIHKPQLVKKIGGTEVLKKAVCAFYQRLTSDPQICVFFEGANVEILKWHEYNLMAIAFHDVPTGFDIRDMILVRHKALFDAGLDEAIYDVVLEHFSQTLRELNVPDESIQDALQIVKPFRVIFQEGAAQAAQRKKQTERRELLWQLGVSTAVALYVGKLIVGRRRK